MTLSVLTPKLLIISCLAALLVACSDASDEPAALTCGSGGPLSGVGGDYNGPYMERTLVMDSGETRSYLLRLPLNYRELERSDVVFTFHGSGSNMLNQLVYSDFTGLADRDNVILVSPDANKVYDYSDNPLGQYWSSAWEANLRERDHDIEFILQLVQQLKAEYCTGDFFGAGMSAGGDMVSALQCLPNSPFKAYSPVTYAYYNAEECRDAPAAPMLYFHGTDDFVVPFDGSSEPWFDPPVPELLAHWAHHNGCDPQAREARVSPEVLQYTYRDCDAPVQWYLVEGGGHTWPGALPRPGLGYTTNDIDASELIWSLFFPETSQ